MNSALIDLLSKCKPVNKQIIAEIIEKKEKQLNSGIILTGKSVDEAMEDLRIARVIIADSTVVKPGDEIVYLRFIGTPLGEEVIILREDEILAVKE